MPILTNCLIDSIGAVSLCISGIKSANAIYKKLEAENANA